jgi:topoisomerase-4 subunit A
MRTLTDEDIDRLLEIRIKKISKYDINKNRKQIKEIKNTIADVTHKLSTLTQTTIAYLNGLIEKYGSRFPRKTQIATFESIDRKAVARQNIKVGYDEESGFFGSEIKNSKYVITMSEYDRVLFISKDGSYRIVGPTDKMLIPGKVIYWDAFDVEEGIKFTVIYKNKSRIAYAKKVHIHKFIKDREYELIKDKAGQIELLLEGNAENILKINFTPAKRQRVTEMEFDLSSIEFTGITARGIRISPKPVSKIKKMKDDYIPKPKNEKSPTLPSNKKNGKKSPGRNTDITFLTDDPIYFKEQLQS